MCRADRAGDRAGPFTQVARNPAHNVEIGGTHTVFAPAYGSPFVRDLDNGRRYGTIEDFRNFVKLTYMSPYLHHSGGTVCEPVDLPVNKRHYDMVYAHMRYSRQAVHGLGHAPEPRRGHGRDGPDPLRRRLPRATRVIVSLVNANSPMVWDATMLGAAKVYARGESGCPDHAVHPRRRDEPGHGRGARSQTLAEALAGMAFCQLVRPGAPVMLGSFASSMSMQSGAPTFGTPEPALILYVMACARPSARRAVPLRGRADRVQDRRRAGGLRVGQHDAADHARRRQLRAPHGRLARGRARDGVREVHPRRRPGRMLARIREGVDLSPNGQALDAILANEPGTHFLGHPHTLANFESAFYRSSNADNGSFEQWDVEGSKDAQRARQRDLEEDARRVRGAADRRRRRRGAARVHRAGQGLLPGLERLMAATSTSVGQAATVAELLTRSRYEVIPLAGAEEQVLEHVPRDVTLTGDRLARQRARPHARARREARSARLSRRAAPLRRDSSSTARTWPS